MLAQSQTAPADLLHPDPPAPDRDRDAELITLYFDRGLEARDIASHFSIPLATLMSWLDRPDIAAHIERVTAFNLRRARDIARESMPSSVQALLDVRDDPYTSKRTNPRALETARKAAAALVRLARPAAGTPRHHLYDSSADKHTIEPSIVVARDHAHVSRAPITPAAQPAPPAALEPSPPSGMMPSIPFDQSDDTAPHRSTPMPVVRRASSLSRRAALVALSAATLAGAAFATLGGMTSAERTNSTEAATQPATAAAKKVRIGVSVPAATHGWTAGIGWWAKRAMTLYPNVEFVYATAPGPEKQVADIEDMLVKGIDGLVVLATESAALTPIAKKAHNKGVFIVNVDRGFTEPVADVFLEGDNKAFGRKAAEFIATKLGGKGNIVILEGIPCTVNTDRVNAFKEVMTRYPDIKILGQQPAMWNREKGLNVMQTFLTQFPKIDAVWAGDDDVALGAIKAIKDAKRDKDLFVFPGAGMKQVVKMIMDNDPLVPANVTYSPSMIGAGIHTAVSILRDGQKDKVMEFMPRHLLIDVEMITPQNAKQYYFEDAIY